MTGEATRDEAVEVSCESSGEPTKDMIVGKLLVLELASYQCDEFIGADKQSGKHGSGGGTESNYDPRVRLVARNKLERGDAVDTAQKQ